MKEWNWGENEHVAITHTEGQRNSWAEVSWGLPVAESQQVQLNRHVTMESIRGERTETGVVRVLERERQRLQHLKYQLLRNLSRYLEAAETLSASHLSHGSWRGRGKWEGQQQEMSHKRKKQIQILVKKPICTSSLLPTLYTVNTSWSCNDYWEIIIILLCCQSAT